MRGYYSFSGSGLAEISKILNLRLRLGNIYPDYLLTSTSCAWLVIIINVSVILI